MNTISFNSANFVARELNYRMTGGWGEGEGATMAYFQSEATFADRFAAMLDEVCALGFPAIDLWIAHLHPSWATDHQIEQAAALLNERGLTVSSLACYLGGGSTELERMAAIARGLKTSIIGGGCRSEWLNEERAEFLDFLNRGDLRFGLENHPEKTAEEVLDKVGDSEGGRIGVTIDTGWFGSQSYTAAQAIVEVGSRLMHVHLKDIFPPERSGDDRDIREGAAVTLKDIGHETCVLGEGCVGIEACVRALQQIGYTGGISIEHEPEDHSPIEDVQLSYLRLQGWLRGEEAKS